MASSRASPIPDAYTAHPQTNISLALADAFINDSVANSTDPFSIAWITSDTTYTIQYLKTGQVDVGITYSPPAEAITIKQGTAKSPAYYAFRDHFLIAGPASNPANLPADSTRRSYSI